MVAVRLFILDIAGYKFRTGGKPCLLQVETGFTPDHRRVLCNIQCFPVGMVSISLMHCQPEPVAIDIVCLIFYRLGQLLELVSRFDRGIGSIFHRLHILCSL